MSRNDRKIGYCKNSKSYYCEVNGAIFNVSNEHPELLMIDDMYEFSEKEVKRVIKLCQAFLEGKFKKGFELIPKEERI